MKASSDCLHAGLWSGPMSGNASREAGVGGHESVLYVVRRFPVRSQTFVVNEVLDHLRSGANVKLLVLEGPGTADYPLADLDPLFEGRVCYLGSEGEASAPGSYLAQRLLRHPRDLAVLCRAGPLLFSHGLRTFAAVAALAVKSRDHLRVAGVVHCHFGDVGRLMALVLTAAGSPARLVTTFHGFDVSRAKFQPLSVYYRELIRRCDLMLPVNRIWKERLVQAGADPGRIHVHHMGVDTAALRPFPPPAGSREPGTLRLCMIGRMVEKKGHKTALEALALLGRRRSDLRLSLTVIGEGPLEGAVKDLVRSLGLGDVVALKGPRTHAQCLEAIAGSDALLLPSRTAADADMEGIPVVLMEAMALGRPVISTRHSGIPELVGDGRSGLLADEGDAAGIAAAIERLADDPTLRLRLATAGRETVTEGFDLQRLGEQLRRHYRALVKGLQIEPGH